MVSFIGRFSAYPALSIQSTRLGTATLCTANTMATVNNTQQQNADVLVQYIVVRKDLVDTLKWPLGSVISQGCHAAVAATWIHKDDPSTIEYCSPDNIDKMHKVTLEVKGEKQLRDISEKLEEACVGHKLWIEQPENIPTCLATKPCWKSQVSAHFKKLKLCK